MGGGDGDRQERLSQGEYVGSCREMRGREREIRGPKTSGGDCPKEGGRRMVVIMVLMGNKFWVFLRELRV